MTCFSCDVAHSSNSLEKTNKDKALEAVVESKKKPDAEWASQKSASLFRGHDQFGEDDFDITGMGDKLTVGFDGIDQYLGGSIKRLGKQDSEDNLCYAFVQFVACSVFRFVYIVLLFVRRTIAHHILLSQRAALVR